MQKMNTKEQKTNREQTQDILGNRENNLEIRRDRIYIIW